MTLHRTPQTILTLLAFTVITTTLLMLTTCAHAAETAPKQTAWQAALVPALGAVGTFLAALLVAGLRRLVLMIEKKWKIDISDSVETMMYEKARWAVAWVEEKAENRLLHGDGQKTSGAQKMSTVVMILQNFANKLGYSQEWQTSKLMALAEGILHLERDVVIGSVGERAQRLEEKKNT